MTIYGNRVVRVESECMLSEHTVDKASDKPWCRGKLGEISDRLWF